MTYLIPVELRAARLTTGLLLGPGLIQSMRRRDEISGLISRVMMSALTNVGKFGSGRLAAAAFKLQPCMKKGWRGKKNPHKTCSRGHFNLGKMKECISRRAMKTSECLAALCSSHEIFQEKEEGRRTHASERSRRGKCLFVVFFSFSLKERDLIMIQYTITLYDITAA